MSAITVAIGPPLWKRLREAFAAEVEKCRLQPPDYWPEAVKDLLGSQIFQKKYWSEEAIINLETLGAATARTTIATADWVALHDSIIPKIGHRLVHERFAKLGSTRARQRLPRQQELFGEIDNLQVNGKYPEELSDAEMIAEEKRLRQLARRLRDFRLWRRQDRQGATESVSP